MWLVVNNEMWNLCNAEGIVVEDTKVMIVYPNHSEQFETSSAVAAANVVCGIGAALNREQRIFKFDAIRKRCGGVAEGDQAETIYKKLCEIADADVQPVRRGEWEYTCVCSECGQIDYSAPNYCPNCGARMEGENE